MRYIEWKRWVRSKPWCLKWFIYLVLFRTIIDNFYYFKKISPLLSPLYIVGLLTPILIFMSYNSRNFPRKEKTKIDQLMFIWGIFVFINLFLLLISNYSLRAIGNVVKYFTPVLLFFYLRRFIRNREDLIGIFQTFLYSVIFALLLIPYNYFFNPQAFRRLTIGRGGGYRFAGGYADVMNYAIIIIIVLMITYYFLLSRVDEIKKKNRFKRLSPIIFFLSIIGLMAIKHTASWGVFLTLTILYIIFHLKKSKNVLVILLFFLFAGIYFQGFINSNIDPLIEKEMKVVRGEAKIDKAFNGRMWRWKRYFRIWEKMPFYSKIFGVSFSAAEERSVFIDGKYRKGYSSVIPLMTSGGMHNDYIRILFISGIFGLSFYLLFLIFIIQRRSFFVPEDRFLILSSFVIIVLYSITSTPTLYPSLIYIIFSVFSYISLPQKIRFRNNEKKDIDFR